MSTPAGYYDPQGNFIPGSFADQLDLPGPGGSDQAAIQAAQQALATEVASGTKYTGDVTSAQAAIKQIQTQLKNKKTPAWVQKQLNVQLAQQKSILARSTAAQTASTARQTELQNKVYEVSGQYEKLLTGDNRNAYAALQSLFNNYGLGTLAPKIYEFAKQGYGADVISLMLQDTKEYKERFAANADRVKQGLPVLSPAEYLSTEQAYRQILSDAGLPKGFYDSPTDFRNWIAGDTSPSEVKGRVDLAVANTSQANPYTKQALADLYGVDESHLLAYFIDEKKALPLLQKQSQAAQFGAEALKRNLALNGQNIEDFVTGGLSLSQVASGYQQIAESLPNIQAIAARYGESFTQSEAERDLIAGNIIGGVADANALFEGPTNKRKRLASQERALFSGFAGATPGGLSAGFQAT